MAESQNHTSQINNNRSLSILIPSHNGSKTGSLNDQFANFAEEINPMDDKINENRSSINGTI